MGSNRAPLYKARESQSEREAIKEISIFPRKSNGRIFHLASKLSLSLSIWEMARCFSNAKLLPALLADHVSVAINRYRGD